MNIKAWIPFIDGPMPVPAGTVIDVRWAVPGARDDDAWQVLADEWDWSGGDNITAYRVCPDQSHYNLRG